MRTTWSEEELKLALNIAEDPTLTWREIAEALHGRGYPKRSPGSVSVLLRNKGAPLRETDSGEPVGNKGGGHHRRPPRRFRRFRRILRAARCRLSLRRTICRAVSCSNRQLCADALVGHGGHAVSPDR